GPRAAEITAGEHEEHFCAERADRRPTAGHAYGVVQRDGGGARVEQIERREDRRAIEARGNGAIERGGVARADERVLEVEENRDGRVRRRAHVTDGDLAEAVGETIARRAIEKRKVDVVDVPIAV